MFVLVRDAYWQRRAWLAWHAGLVASGQVRRFDDLVPAPSQVIDDDEREAVRHRRNAHNFKLWCAVFSAQDQKGTA